MAASKNPVAEEGRVVVAGDKRPVAGDRVAVGNWGMDAAGTVTAAAVLTLWDSREVGLEVDTEVFLGIATANVPSVDYGMAEEAPVIPQ